MVCDMDTWVVYEVTRLAKSRSLTSKVAMSRLAVISKVVQKAFLYERVLTLPAEQR